MGDHHWPDDQAAPTDTEVADALAMTGYVYSDPVHDGDWPHIVGAIELPEFPPGWSDRPTERDQAAIDAAGGE